ncbi:magnesium/cobalt transporter CorA [Brumicola nitratireducens]|uniref:Magnesium transport protein CorA n=1 Tax=Glaciecola nitratireducens (strain JCM 12485 / KCTC 12276 / FR1064) TaxID=1085623 RepID=G4QFW0_GLANF|nr:magnesium/cobalt transporter CorA [Glaciecola nitratireducens]AEP29051.1 magnesium and cobalt transport protein CorA [Glaciecola nitratireducens FR1064]
MKLFNKKYHKPGTRPGTLKTNENAVFSVDLYDYNATVFNAQLNVDVSTCKSFIESENCTWIHVQGDPSAEAMKLLGKDLGIHELYVEDVINVGQRPKVEINDEQIFLILNLPVKEGSSARVDQVSLFLSKTTLISFSTGKNNPFLAVIERLENKIGKLRKQQSDYLLYALIDTVIDFGFPMLETYSEQIQALEDELMETKNERLLSSIHELRRDLLLIRRRLWPQREVINELLRADDNPLLQDNTLLHLRDCHDHVISIMEMLETYHEMTSGLMELYLTSVSLKLNDVMKFLTIFTTIFIPPTFLVGVYGMNFRSENSPTNMPELDWQFGYLMVWGIIALMIGGMLYFFRRKKWI